MIVVPTINTLSPISNLLVDTLFPFTYIPYLLSIASTKYPLPSLINFACLGLTYGLFIRIFWSGALPIEYSLF